MQFAWWGCGGGTEGPEGVRSGLGGGTEGAEGARRGRRGAAECRRRRSQARRRSRSRRAHARVGIAAFTLRCRLPPRREPIDRALSGFHATTSSSPASPWRARRARRAPRAAAAACWRRALSNEDVTRPPLAAAAAAPVAAARRRAADPNPNLNQVKSGPRAGAREAGEGSAEGSGVRLTAWRGCSHGHGAKPLHIPVRGPQHTQRACTLWRTSAPAERTSGPAGCGLGTALAVTGSAGSSRTCSGVIVATGPFTLCLLGMTICNGTAQTRMRRR